MTRLPAQFLAVILLFCLYGTSFAIDVRVKGHWGPPWGWAGQGPGSVPEGVRFPITYYLFADEICLYRPDGVWSKKIPLPLYIGYIAVDADYRLRFVDKSGGLGTPVQAMVIALNMYGKDAVVGDRGGQTIPRWSWNGFRLSIWEMRYKSFTIRSYVTQGAPDDGFIPHFIKDRLSKYSDHFSIQNTPAGATVIEPSW